jgi:succinoglycan biosynthesis protein ExoM
VCAGFAAPGLVAVCVATHKRLHGLDRLLESLKALTFTECGEPSVEVVIVDNDPSLSAQALCAARALTSRWPLFYVSEPRRGISFARNAAIRQARARDAEFIAFIDDDEIPTPAWLDELLSAISRYDADVVAGPVLPVFEASVAPWMVRCGFFERPRHDTGTRLETTRSGNVVFRTRILEQGIEMFDEGLGLSGGEDTDFFFRVAAAGHAIVWADDAVVHEWNPVTRTQTSWILRRAFNTGATWAASRNSFRPYTRMALRGLAKGLLLLPISAIKGRHAVVSSLELVAVGAGYLSGKSGLRFERYRKTDGR